MDYHELFLLEPTLTKFGIRLKVRTSCIFLCRVIKIVTSTTKKQNKNKTKQNKNLYVFYDMLSKNMSIMVIHNNLLSH